MGKRSRRGAHWERHNKKIDVIKDTPCLMDESAMSGQISGEYDQSRDINWLLSLRPDLCPFHQELLDSTLVWLQAAPRRSLGRWSKKTGWRGFYKSLSKQIALGRYDKSMQFTVEEKKRIADKMEKSAEARKTRLGWPDWFENKDLLPKKPPT